MRGTQNRSEIPDGANGSGEPLPRPLLRPSPSANLVGTWKGDRLGSRRVGTPSDLPNAKRVALSRGGEPSRCAATSEIGYDRRHVGSSLACSESLSFHVPRAVACRTA